MNVRRGHGRKKNKTVQEGEEKKEKVYQNLQTGARFLFLDV